MTWHCTVHHQIIKWKRRRSSDRVVYRVLSEVFHNKMNLNYLILPNFNYYYLIENRLVGRVFCYYIRSGFMIVYNEFLWLLTDFYLSSTLPLNIEVFFHHRDSPKGSKCREVNSCSWSTGVFFRFEVYLSLCGRMV